MSDSELLRRRYNRERDARREAERLLEIKSQELFDAKEAAERARLEFLDAFESIDDGFLLFGDDEKLVWVNERWKEMYPELADRVNPGITFSEIVEAKAANNDIGDADSPEAFVARRITHFRNPVTSAFEKVRPDGRTYLITERRTRRGAHVSTYKDISELKNAQEKEAALRDQFNQAQKMDAIGRLAGGIAHDFNNILAAILGYATFLAEDLEKDSDLHRYAGHIMESGERARNLVQQILTFSRHHDTGFEPTNVVELTRAVESMLRPTIPSNIEIRTDIGPDTATVRGNPTQIEQVLVNIVVNARDAHDDDSGVIDIRVRPAGEVPESRFAIPGAHEPIIEPNQRLGFSTGPDGQARAWLGAIDRQRDYICIEISDQGTGIEEDTLRRIFEPFFTTKEKGRGTGLGLAAVHGIVTAHGGAVVVTSRLGKGTRFHVFLPLFRPDSPTAETQPETGTRTGGNHELILVVDDESAVRSVVTTILAREGYEAVAVDSGAAALELLKDAGDAVAAIISDYMMPGMTGLELIRRVRPDHPELPIILCSGYTEDVRKSDLMEAGANAYLAKPVRPHDVARTLQELIAPSG